MQKIKKLFFSILWQFIMFLMSMTVWSCYCQQAHMSTQINCVSFQNHTIVKYMQQFCLVKAHQHDFKQISPCKPRLACCIISLYVYRSNIQQISAEWTRIILYINICVHTHTAEWVCGDVRRWGRESAAFFGNNSKLFTIRAWEQLGIFFIYPKNYFKIFSLTLKLEMIISLSVCE